MELLGVLVKYPLLAIMPIAVFLFLFAVSKNNSAKIAAILWLGYMLYEYTVKLRLICSGECNIRVDLLLIYPVLMIVSLLALARSLSVLENKK
jgi:hypothetical protein